MIVFWFILWLYIRTPPIKVLLFSTPQLPVNSNSYLTRFLTYFQKDCGAIRQALVDWAYRNSWEKLPGTQVDGQAVHSLKGVTMQSFLQGSKQGLMVSGRAASEHLNIQTNNGLKFSFSPRQCMINTAPVTGHCSEKTALSLTSHISTQRTWLITCPLACTLKQKGAQI